jgi:DNA transformation protein and related proteins
MERNADQPVVETRARLSDLKNIGPVTEQRLNEAGIRTPAELERLGPVEAYRRIKIRYPEDTTLVLLYALQGALWDAHWNELPLQTKSDLKSQLC